MDIYIYSVQKSNDNFFVEKLIVTKWIVLKIESVPNTFFSFLVTVNTCSDSKNRIVERYMHTIHCLTSLYLLS